VFNEIQSPPNKEMWAAPLEKWLCKTPSSFLGSTMGQRSLTANSKVTWIGVMLLIGLGLVVFAVIKHRAEKVVWVEPDYYTNRTGALSAKLIIRSGWRLPMVVRIGTSISATVQTKQEDTQSYFERFGSNADGYFANCAVPSLPWRVRFSSVDSYQIRVGPYHFNLPPQTNIVTTQELPTRDEALKNAGVKIRFDPDN
jgi:hypothetical protein